MERVLLVVTLAVLALVVFTGATSQATGRYQIASEKPGFFWRVDTQTGKVCWMGYVQRDSAVLRYRCSKVPEE